MTTALVSQTPPPDAPDLARDVLAAGFIVSGQVNCSELMQTSIQIAPDVIIIHQTTIDPALFQGISLINSLAPVPVVVFTADQEAEKIEAAARAGIHAYVVNGYSPNRLRPVVHLAQARFRHAQSLRSELQDVTQRFEERKLVDRAKGILMGARQLREDEAFRALRNAAMHTKQRIGQVSQQVIDSARYGEAINRAGQLRMLSQRLVKLCVLGLATIRPDETARLFADSLGQVDQNLAILKRSLSQPTFGDLLDAVMQPWSALRSALAAPTMDRLEEIDRLAELVLLRAERLTSNLEVAGFAAALHVINVAGRQRMLSQRLAKQALLGDARNAGETRAELVAGFAYLLRLPLSNASIARELEGATAAWEALQAALLTIGSAAGQDAVAVSSEALLGHFDRLTEHLERGMQSLVQ